MEQPVSYYSEGARISAVLYLPEGDQRGKRLPGVVLCNGFTGIKELILPDYAQRFAAAGYAALAFDYRGFGTSEGERGRLIWHDQVKDVQNSLTFLETLDQLDPERLGLWGTSYGAANAVFVAALDDRAKCVVSQVGFADGGRKMRTRPPEDSAAFWELIRNERRQRVLTGKSTMLDPLQVSSDPDTAEFFEEAIRRLPTLRTEICLEFLERNLEYRPEAVAGSISPRALLLIAAENDVTTPVDESRALYAAAGEPRRLEVIEGIRHYDIYRGEGLERSARLAIDWFDQYL